MKIKEVIVVEGKCDTVKIKQAVQADTIETNGSAIDQATLRLIQHAKEKRGVIVFTDPDFQGERIRRIINDAVPGCKHAFLAKQEAKSNKTKQSLGIEHAANEVIQAALASVYEAADIDISDITKQDLIRHGLIGASDAKESREQLGELLRIGYTNGKQLLNRLQMFQITKDELNQAMMYILARRTK